MAGTIDSWIGIRTFDTELKTNNNIPVHDQANGNQLTSINKNIDNLYKLYKRTYEQQNNINDDTIDALDNLAQAQADNDESQTRNAKDLLAAQKRSASESQKRAIDFLTSLSGVKIAVSENTTTTEKTTKEKKEQDKKISAQALANTRAAANVLQSDIKKIPTATEVLKDALVNALKGLRDMAAENFRQSIKSFSDLSAVLRKANLSTEDKNKIQLATSTAVWDVSAMFNGLQVSRNEINSYMGDLIASGKDITSMTRDQIAAYTALRKRGVESSNAYITSMTANQESLKNLVNGLSNVPGLSQLINESLGKLTKSQIANMGGMDAAIASLVSPAKQLIESYGNAGLATGDFARVLTESAKLEHGLIDQIDTTMAPWLNPNAMSTMQNLQKSNLALLTRVGALDDNFATLSLFNKAGAEMGQHIYTDTQVEANNRQNTTNGKLAQWVDDLVSGFDIITGGLLGKASNTLDEYFGGQLTLEHVVSNGFKLVYDILKSIYNHMLVSGVLNVTGLGSKITNMITGKFGNLTGAASKAGDALTGAASKTSKLFTKAGSGLFAKVAAPLTIAVGAITTAAEVHSISNEKYSSFLSKHASSETKRFEKEEQEKLRNEKKKNAIAKGGIQTAAALGLGAIGTAIAGPVGGIVGGVVGGIVGDAIGGYIDKDTEHKEDIFKTKSQTKNIADLRNKLAEINNLLKKDIAPSVRASLQKDAAEAQSELAAAQQAEFDTLVNAYKGDNDQSSLLNQITATLKQSDANYDNANKKLSLLNTALEEFNTSNKVSDKTINELIKSGINASDFNKGDVLANIGYHIGEQTKIKDSAYKDLIGSRAAITLANEGVNLREYGNNVGAIINRTRDEASNLAARGHGVWTAEAFERSMGATSYKNMMFDNKDFKDIASNTDTEVLYKFLDKQLSYISDDNIKYATIAGIIAEVQNDKDKSRLGVDKLPEELAKQNKDTAIDIVMRLHEGKGIPVSISNIDGFANGGILNSPTPAVIGEAGKEVVLPLTRPDRMIDLLSKLTNNEKLLLIKSILSGGNLLSFIKNIFFNSNSRQQTAQEHSEYTDALAKLEAWQGGKLKPADFIAMFGPIAREDMRATGIPAAITIAQAALESGWGKSARTDFRNLFGIKGTGDAGSKVVPTHEFTAAGERYNKKDTFAQYSSYLASINAHSHYLLNAKRKKGLNGLRYGEALLYTDDSDMFAHKLKECGYATSPTYAEKLISLMRQYDLYKYNINGIKPNINGAELTASTDTGAAAVIGKSIADNAIAYARDQINKPYSIYSDGFVCNTLVQSAFKSAGMKKFPSGTVSTHWKNPNLHKVNLSDAKPGMIGFSNKSDKTGMPQHMGIITENGMWINSSGSAVNGNYKWGEFVATPGSKGVQEAKMRSDKWGMVGAGYYDGMFDGTASNYVATKQNDIPDGIKTNDDELAKSNINTDNGLLSREKINESLKANDISSIDAVTASYITQAMSLMNNNNKDDILKILIEIARYLKGMSSNKYTSAAVSRPMSSVYS